MKDVLAGPSVSQSGPEQAYDAPEKGGIFRALPLRSEQSVPERLRILPKYVLGGSDHVATSTTSRVDYTLKMAEQWKAIMLLEDASDHCAGPDQKRQFVECLLRVLEGRKTAAPLIMTSHRIHAFPPTMLHRLTLAVEYTIPDYTQRLQLWKQSINDILEGAPRDELLMPTEKPGMHSENLRELASKPFNALDIQGVIKCARALAASQQEPLSIQHFRGLIYQNEKLLREAGMLIGPEEDVEEDDDVSEVSEAGEV